MATKDKDVRRGHFISGQVCSCMDSLTARNSPLYRNLGGTVRLTAV